MVKMKVLNRAKEGKLRSLTILCNVLYRGRLHPQHCIIVPTEHVPSSRKVDEHVWTEMRNFKKCVIQMHAKQVGRSFLTTRQNDQKHALIILSIHMLLDKDEMELHQHVIRWFPSHSNVHISFSCMSRVITVSTLAAVILICLSNASTLARVGKYSRQGEFCQRM